MDTPSSTVGPGIGAFLAFFLLALFLWLLMRNMNGRMRRMAYREQQRVAELEARDASAQEEPQAQEQRQEQAQEQGQRQAERSVQTEPDDPTP
jgi:uncharacterized protein (TIGR03382 family)